MTLDRLWAGWRNQYVVSGGDEGVPPGDGSIFTRILAAGLPDEKTHIVWRGETVFVILNAYPYGTGHMLVMPYREVAELEELTPDESDELWSTTKKAVAAARRAYDPDGVNVGLNLGAAAGAGVPGHLHVHVLPRWSADSNFMTAVAETRVLPESLGTSWQKLRDAWSTDV
jgi:diadenosine tetraphosphate (Ap4A) HIT family hydrolase